MEEHRLHWLINSLLYFNVSWKVRHLSNFIETQITLVDKHSVSCISVFLRKSGTLLQWSFEPPRNTHHTTRRHIPGHLNSQHYRWTSYLAWCSCFLSRDSCRNKISNEPNKRVAYLYTFQLEMFMQSCLGGRVHNTLGKASPKLVKLWTGFMAQKKSWDTVVEFCVLLRRNHIALEINPYSPAVTFFTTSFNTQNSTFCPHSVFLCFVWIWEQAAIISQHSINWMILRGVLLSP